jgi:hypothetical protein
LGKLSGEHLSRPRDKNHKSSVWSKWQKSPNNWKTFLYFSLYLQLNSFLSHTGQHVWFIMTLHWRRSTPILFNINLKAVSSCRYTGWSMQMTRLWAA